VTALLQCTHCHHVLFDPLTTHCGHTFCRLCALYLKVTDNQCALCCLPLPRYTSIEQQGRNQWIDRVLHSIKSSPQNNSRECQDTRVLGTANRHTLPVFTSQAVFLPTQRFRLSITPMDTVRFRTALIRSTRYQGPCLAIVMVQQGSMTLSSMGTLVKVLGVEHRPDLLLVDFLGVDRFKMIQSEHKIPCPIATVVILPEILLREEEILPQEQDPFIIHTFIHRLTDTYFADSTYHLQSPPSVDGLLGPSWFKNIQLLHGPFPVIQSPAAMCWWIALALPVQNKDRWILLKTLDIQKRLILVLTWIQRLESQWT
ncbi:hypothetical protein BDF14DRAFT_1700352, partial [Spinellus fusiger]